ncbi:MAG: hypothetical protein ABIO70_15290 [Pseudomonadota bacterium]
MSWRLAGLLVVAATLLATAAIWAPGALLYMDVPCHLAEVHALATEILPGQRWLHGWSDIANAGGDVGGLNAPLPWSALALLTWAGLPLAVGFRLFTVGSVALCGLGAMALGRRLGLGVGAAALAGVLVAVAPLDTLGIGGALGGMWPYRLANGLLLVGLARLDLERPRLGPSALWLAAVLLCHAYAGVVAAGVLALVMGEQVLRRHWTMLGVSAVNAALAALISLPWWLPQVRGGAAAVQEITHLRPLAALAMLLLPLRPHDLLTGARPALLGGVWSLGGAVVGVVGLAGAAWRLSRGARPSPWALRLAGALGVLLALALLGGFGLLGPNPWRHLAQGRVALALVVAAGLEPWLAGRARGWALGLALAGLTAVAGYHTLPCGWRVEDRAAVGALEATWADLAAAAPQGRVYHQETFLDPTWRGPLAWSHVGPMLSVEHGLPTLGSWYGVTPVPTVPFTADQGVGLMGTRQAAVLAEPDWLYARFRRFGVGATVTVEPALEAALGADVRYRRVGGRAPFAAFVLREAPLGPLGVADPAALVTLADRGATALSARIEVAGPADFVLRQAWDPGWSATLDGAPLALAAGPDDGLITGRLPGSGELALHWRPRSRPWAPLGLAALGVALALGGRSRRGESA